jgi:hypothetical protein
MPADFITLLLPPFYPFRRYHHGSDSPDQLNKRYFLPTAFEGKLLLLPWPFNVFALSFIAQRLNGFEPFLHPVRHTGTQPIFPKLENVGVRKERKR